MTARVPRTPGLRVKINTLDVSATRRYLHTIEEMAREASSSNDPRVLLLALDVLNLAPRTMQQFRGPL